MISTWTHRGDRTPRSSGVRGFRGSLYIRARQDPEVVAAAGGAPGASVMPAMARWKAWLCRFAGAGSRTRPGGQKRGPGARRGRRPRRRRSGRPRRRRYGLPRPVPSLWPGQGRWGMGVSERAGHSGGSPLDGIVINQCPSSGPFATRLFPGKERLVRRLILGMLGWATMALVGEPYGLCRSTRFIGGREEGRIRVRSCRWRSCQRRTGQ